jgi:lipoprotein-anchoring transpeptidase ErfK/SrfK
MIADLRTTKHRVIAISVVAVVAPAAVGISALSGVLGHRPPVEISVHRTGASGARISVPPPVKPAFVPRNPAPLTDKNTMSRWAPVRSTEAARARPERNARIIARVATKTPEGTVNIMSVLGTKEDRDGRLWVHVRLPVLPNGTTGWIPRSALGGYGYVATRLVVDLDRFKATLLRGHKPVFRAEVGVGKPSSPTPKGHFYIRDRVTDFNNPFYGPIAFGTSARSNSLTDWPGGGFIGIHGTNQPTLIPGAISHGCIRLTNSDIVKLARLMPVGTPVIVR